MITEKVNTQWELSADDVLRELLRLRREVNNLEDDMDNVIQWADEDVYFYGKMQSLLDETLTALHKAFASLDEAITEILDYRERQKL